MLSLTWFIGPTLLSLSLCIYLCVWFTRKSDPDIVEDPFRIPHESPVHRIYFPRKQETILDQQKRLYQVAFRHEKKVRYWLHADDIIKYCKKHNQRVPYIVGIGKERYKGSIDYGDELLKIE